ncbi:hypothetical protein [Neobacillus sp.]|uniref:hypothetical protein n=1 Tax=Neobacillus sp. TaxID=2675273 RepID=UPI0028A27DDA|nr:hypothetical protein [Neobacillus sp.]
MMLLFKAGKFIKVKVFVYGDHYLSTASTRGCSVWNCLGTTRKKAKEMALLRLDQALNEVKKEMDRVIEREDYSVYHEKK